MSHPPRAHSDAERDAEERVLAMTAHLPEVEAVTDGHDHRVLRVRGKTFLYLGSHGERGVGLSVKTDKATQAELIATGRYTRTGYIGQHGWVSTTVGAIGWEEVEERVIESYWRVAPKSLVKAHGPR